MMDDRWISVEEIAAYPCLPKLRRRPVGIKRDTVYKWIADKRMPAHKVGRLWKFRKEEVDEWVRGGIAAANKRRRKD